MNSKRIAHLLGTAIQTVFWVGLYLGLFAYVLSRTASVNLFRYATF
jgi:putative methionine-R-sulfoxide reductase with GAF domain